MRDYESVAKSLQCCASDSEPCEHCNCELEECNPKTIMEIAADAIEELLAENKAIKQSNKDAAMRNKLLCDEISHMKEKVPHWISVEKRLPEDQGDDARAARGGDYIHKVLAASVTPNYTVMDTAYLENGIWSLSQYTSWKQIIGAPVTHWMPLPAPPKGVE